MRCFIALELNAEIKKLIAGIQNDLRRSCDCPVKWVKPDNAHLTLKFLGETKETKLDKIKKALGEIAQSTQSFESELTSVGSFPPDRPARVIWVGLSDKEKRLSTIAGHVEDQMQRLKFSREKRRFVPHITIGRVKPSKNAKALTETIRNYPPIPPIKQLITAITLFQSTLTPDGPVYEALERFAFPY